MSQQPFSTEGLNQDEIEVFSDTYITLRSFCDARFLEEITLDINLDNFECLNEYDRFGITELIQVGENAYIAITDVNYTFAGNKGARHSVNQYEAWGVAALHNNFGHVFIKPEGFKEKLIELIKPMELDFEEDPAFSKRFYVLAKDQQKAIRHINPSFRTALLNAGLKNFALEIHQNMLLIGNNKYLNPADAENFARFVQKVAQIR
jgi:hypothetical protein